MMKSRERHTVSAPIADPCPPVGILDWGIGGLGFFRLLRARRPDIAVTYFSDAGETPYGRLSRQRLMHRLQLIETFLHQRGVTHLVVACNALSTVLPRAQGPIVPGRVKTIGVIEPTIQFLRASKNKRYGIVGGRRTILSGSYRTPLTNAGKRVRQRIAQPLSRLIEDGKMNTSEFAEVLEGIVRPLRSVDALILGCTHYIAALPQFSSFLPGVPVIDPAELTLAWIERRWSLPGSKQRDVFFTTGSVPMMRTAARRAFGVELGKIRKLNVDLHRYL
jgi:glutamate racemase